MAGTAVTLFISGTTYTLTQTAFEEEYTVANINYDFAFGFFRFLTNE